MYSGGKTCHMSAHWVCMATKSLPKLNYWTAPNCAGRTCCCRARMFSPDDISSAAYRLRASSRADLNLALSSTAAALVPPASILQDWEEPIDSEPATGGPEPTSDSALVRPSLDSIGPALLRLKIFCTSHSTLDHTFGPESAKALKQSMNHSAVCINMFHCQPEYNACYNRFRR
jgi:hypothetical protein